MSQLPRPGRRALGPDGRRVLLRLLVLLIACVFVFAIVVRIDRTVLGRGSLVAVEGRTDVRASVGGVVAATLVAEGERVRAGQVLLRLESKEADGRLARVEQRQAAVERDLARLVVTQSALEAAIAGDTPAAVPEPAAAEALEVWRAAVSRLGEESRLQETTLPSQRALSAARLAARAAAVDAATAELARAEAEINRQQTLLDRNIAKRADYEDAVAARAVAASRLDQARAAVNEERQALPVFEASAVERLASAEAARAAAVARLRDERAQLVARARTARSEREVLVAEHAAVERSLEHLRVTAPVAGLVKFAAEVSAGDRVEAGARLFALSTTDLVFAEAHFDNRDAGRLHAGIACKVKLDAFPYEEFGAIPARLERIDLEPTIDATTGASAYRVTVALKHMAIGEAPARPLTAGLALTVEAITDRPRLLSLLLDPVRRLLSGRGLGVPSAWSGAPDAPPPPPVPDRAATPFDRERAFAHLEALAELGPRPAGSAALSLARRYVRDELVRLGLRVEEDRFEVEVAGQPRELVNLYARIPSVSEADPDRAPRLALATHLDTKRLEGARGFQGANDGASGAAVLLEVARVLVAEGARIGRAEPIELVFVDGREGPAGAGGRGALVGSARYAERVLARPTPTRVVVCTMVGDPSLLFTDDLRSDPDLADELVAAGERAGWSDRFERARPDSIPFPVEADHVPLLRLGLPAAALIDFDFGGRDVPRRAARNRLWRTGQDRVEAVSARSLQVAGDVLLELVAPSGSEGR